jgi:hypothetical protein
MSEYKSASSIFHLFVRHYSGILTKLAVCESIHRVHDNCLYPAPTAAPQDMVDDGNNVCQALAGSGASREEVIPASARSTNRIGLMLI